MSFLRVSYRAQLSAATSSLVSFYGDDLLKLARNNSHSDLRNASPASFCLYGWLDSVFHGRVESGSPENVLRSLFTGKLTVPNYPAHQLFDVWTTRNHKNGQRRGENSCVDRA